MEKRFSISLLASLGLIATLALVPPAAASASGSGAQGVFEQPPGTELLRDIPKNGASTVPNGVKKAIAELQTGPLAGLVNNIRWDEDARQVTVWAFGVTPQVESIFNQQELTGVKVDIRPSVRSKKDIEAAVERLAGKDGTLANGQRVVYASPSADGSSIAVALDKTKLLTSRSIALPTTFEGIPLVITTTDPTAPTARIRTDAPVLTGGYMEGQGLACTTGFPLMRSDGAYANLSADHCSPSPGGWWNWGNSGGPEKVGQSSGQAPSNSDFEIFLGTTSPSVYSLIGDAWTSNVVVPLKGYYTPVQGDSVCYNGARSGTVCGNVVVDTNAYVCYAFLQCYWNFRTEQTDRIPATGNGDSGGPVMSFVQNGDYVDGYGAGIISGMPTADASANCTGEPGSTAAGGRKCSWNLFFAPLYRFTNENSSLWSLLVAP